MPRGLAQGAIISWEGQIMTCQAKAHGPPKLTETGHGRGLTHAIMKTGSQGSQCTSSAQDLDVGELRPESKAFSPPGGQAGQASPSSEEAPSSSAHSIPQSQRVPGLGADMGWPLKRCRFREDR